MNRFYLLLAGIAVVGGGAIFVMAQRGGGGPDVRTVAPRVDGAGAGEVLTGQVLGIPTAPVEVEEYADFQCPACQRFAILTMPDVIQRYINTGRVRWRFIDFPLSGHDKSPAAHEAAACAGEQGKFWEMHDQLYYNQNAWVSARNTERTIRGYAEKLGLDMGQYSECLSSDRFPARFQATVQAAVARGVNSTPTFIIGDKMVSGALPFDQFKLLLDSAAVTPTS